MSAEGMVCPTCSVQNAPGANFCTACGAELVSDEVATGTFPVAGVDVAGDGEVGQLVVTRGASAGSRYALESPEVTIGRHPQSAIFLDDVTVSRRHAVIRSDATGHYTLEDAGSLNGTYLDGERVDVAVLREGAQIQVGKFRLVFVIGALGGAA